MKIKIVSFGKKHGKYETDLNAFFDVRFLENPYWDENLKYKTGLDKAVREYVLKTDSGKKYLKEIVSTLETSLEAWDKSSRTEIFVIGVACTGGQHRSVTIAIELAEYFKDKYTIELEHRDLQKKEDKNLHKIAKDSNYVPKVLCFGGGTGLSALLEGLKKYPLDITAVVTVADDGGSTGVLREQFDMPAPGDLRRVLLSLSNDPLTSTLMNYRFEEGNDLANHTIGNIVIAGLYKSCGDDFFDTIEKLSKILKIKGKVLPISEDLVKLQAEYKDGSIAVGEAVIPNRSKSIAKMSYNNNVSVNKEVIQAILEADLIVYSSGSLYTSLIPNLLFDEVKNALRRSYASSVYVSNLMTQIGETTGYNLENHVDCIENEIENYSIDHIIVNNNFDVPVNILSNYKEEGSSFVELTELSDKNIILDDLITISSDDHIRHNTRRIGFHIFNLAYKKAMGIDER